jgi:Ca2+-binding RTX toxin-like protein
LYATAVSANLATGAATRVANGVSGIENVTGGNGDDLLIGDNANNFLRGGAAGNDILLGGGGIDTLWGLAGRDFLIGGLGADNLDGGAGDDILIDGTTDLDADSVALAAVRTEWAKNSNYNQRIQSLNGTLTAASVHHDASADTLKGNLDRDWFWADGLDTTDAILSGMNAEKVN